MPAEDQGSDLVEFRLNGHLVNVAKSGSLLDALRERLAVKSAKDGCSPQGQCGCCTVWVDGHPRVSCVTPVARIVGRDVTTLEGVETAAEWAERFQSCGASQCGFCTPGIVMRLAALSPQQRSTRHAIDKAMLAHVCRCTGWQTIVEAAVGFDPQTSGDEHPGDKPPIDNPLDVFGSDDRVAAERRALVEGRVPQSVGADVVLGRGGFADDKAPAQAKVALRAVDGSWVVGDDLAHARELSGKVQGRRTTAPYSWPVPLPDGNYVRRLQTTWVEPAYLEPDASWCEPGGVAVSTYGNGGAFGGKESPEIGDTARRLADLHGCPVRVLSTREDIVRLGPKRPPVAIGVDADGRGAINIGVSNANSESFRVELAELATCWPTFRFATVPVVGPKVSLALRAAVTAELHAVVAAVTQPGPTYSVSTADGGYAAAEIDDDGVHIVVRCGKPLDEVVLRSYCMGAVHMALGMVRSEGISVGGDGVPLDLTMRSFGVLRSMETPPVEVEISADDGPPVNGSDAVFAATLAAAWSRADFAPRWPVSTELR